MAKKFRRSLACAHAISPYGTIAWTDSSRLGIPLPRGATALPWRSSDGDSPAGIVAGLTKTPLAPSDARRAAVYAEAVMHKPRLQSHHRR